MLQPLLLVLALAISQAAPAAPSAHATTKPTEAAHDGNAFTFSSPSSGPICCTGVCPCTPDVCPCLRDRDPDPPARTPAPHPETNTTRSLVLLHLPVQHAHVALVLPGEHLSLTALDAATSHDAISAPQRLARLCIWQT